MSQIDNTKYFALLEEVETSYKLINLGLGEIQNINLNNDFYFLPFQLLSQGFERFMKAYICLGYLFINQELPNYKYLKNLGHDLEKLLSEILDKYYFDFSRPQFNIDNKFLKNDNELKELLYILSEFGKLARYYNFDLITNNAAIGVDTKRLWEKYENSLLDPHDYEKLIDYNLSHEVYQKLSTAIITTFEKFLSALSRQLVFNCLGKTSLQLTCNTFFEFGRLYDKDFGKKDYRKNTTRYKEKEFKTHRRTIFDYIQRKYNPNYISIKVFKSEYEDDWPFYVDDVIIECRHQHWCVVTIDGKDYALNGTAKRRYKLDFPDDAGMALLGKSTSDLIQRALRLRK